METSCLNQSYPVLTVMGEVYTKNEIRDEIYITVIVEGRKIQLSLVGNIILSAWIRALVIYSLAQLFGMDKRMESVLQPLFGVKCL